MRFFYGEKYKKGSEKENERRDFFQLPLNQMEFPQNRFL